MCAQSLAAVGKNASRVQPHSVSLVSIGNHRVQVTVTVKVAKGETVAAVISEPLAAINKRTRSDQSQGNRIALQAEISAGRIP